MRARSIDLRSDTVTRPTAAMREAMLGAELGDDVFGDDPTVAALEARVAERLGQEAALFVPSGTMANQVAMRTHTEPGDEVIAEARSHVFLYEGGGYAALAGVSMRCVEAERGILDADAVVAAIRPVDPWSHYPVSKLVCLENTANRAGGTVYSIDASRRVVDAAHEHGLRTHLDGARLFNAAVALGVEVAELGAPFDSVSLCLSKGLGCPVGSVLAGGHAFIERAHRFRKMLGGGMRQAGILAAAGLYALDHHVERLAEDHLRARRLAEALDALPGVAVDLAAVETNMVYADVAASGRSGEAWVAALAERDVLTAALDARTLRFVTHLDVDDPGLERVMAACAAVAAS